MGRGIAVSRAGRALAKSERAEKVYETELKEGDVFENYNMSVQTFRRLNEIAVNSYEWEVLEGDITIKKITLVTSKNVQDTVLDMLLNQINLTVPSLQNKNNSI